MKQNVQHIFSGGSFARLYVRRNLRRGVLMLCVLAASGGVSTFAKAETAAPFQNVSYRPNSDSSSPSATDSCLPLLKSIHNPSSVAERTQRTAGTAAAIGLLLGARYALSPPQKSYRATADVSSAKLVSAKRLSDEASPIENRSALAVFAYRQCRKQQALAEVRQTLY